MSEVLGLHVEPKDLSALQVCLRGVIVFLYSLVIVRLANRRFLAKMAAFDVILGFMLASMLARAINGSAAFFPTLVCGLVLVLLHRFLAILAFRSELVGFLVKGEADQLVQDGEPKPDALRVHRISDKDLLEEIRLQGSVTELAKVKTAIMERNGKISVVTESK